MAVDADIEIEISPDLERYIAEMRRAEQTTRAMAKAQGVSAGTIRKAERALQRQERQNLKTSRSTDLMSRAFGRLSPQAASAMSALEGVSSAGIGVGAAAAPVGVMVAQVAALAAVAYGTASAMSELVDEHVNLEKATGLSLATSVALKEALAAQGVDLQSTMLSEFAGKVATAAAKGGEAADAFERLGLSHKKADGTARELNAVFLDAIALIDEQGTASEKAAMRLQIFGNEAGRALAALDGDTLRAAERNTQNLTAAIEGAKDESAEWDQAMARLDTAVDTLTVKLGSNFASDISTIVRTITSAIDVTSEWADELAFIGRMVAPGGQLWHLLSDESVQSWTDWAFGVDEATASTAKLREQFEQMRAVDSFSMADDLNASVPWAQEYDPQTAAERKRFAEKQAAEEQERREKAAKAAARVMADQRKAEAANREARLQFDYELNREFEDGRAAQAAQAQALMEEQAKQDEAAAQRAAQAAQQRISAMEAERAAQEALTMARMDGLQALIGSSGALVGVLAQNAQAIAGAKLLETIAYQAVAVARAFADGGPLLGPAAAIGALAAIGTQIGALQQARQQSHMGSQPLQGSGTPDETTVRVRDGQRIVSELDERRQTSTPAVQVVVGNQWWTAATRQHDRHKTLHTDRRRESVAVGQA